MGITTIEWKELYNNTCLHNHSPARSFQSKCMPGRLALGAAGGSLTTLAVSLLQQLSSPEDLLLPPLSCDCSGVEVVGEIWFWTFLFGLICGLAIWPVLDILILVRLRWTRWIALSLAAYRSPRPLHRVLHD